MCTGTVLQLLYLLHVLVLSIVLHPVEHAPVALLPVCVRVGWVAVRDVHLEYALRSSALFTSVMVHKPCNKINKLEEVVLDGRILNSVYCKAYTISPFFLHTILSKKWREDIYFVSKI